jgi:hypothetical protein
MIVITVNKVRSSKKLVLFFRFLENASRQISESRGQFEYLPEASQTAVLNTAFAADHIDVKELRDFGQKIKDYFKLSPSFNMAYQSHNMIDPELKKHCEIVKYQKASAKDIAEYYIAYMDRMGKEADPRVKDKLKKNQYDTNIIPNHILAQQQQQAAFPGQYGVYGMPQTPQMAGMPHMQNFPGMPPQQQQIAPYNPFAAVPNAHNGGGYNMGGPSPTGGFNMGGGLGQAKPINADQHYNPFQNLAGSPSEQVPYGNKAPDYLTGSSFGAPVRAPSKTGQFDDIFPDQNQGSSAPAFGGDKKPTGSDSTDDFLKQLDDLKKL